MVKIANINLDLRLRLSVLVVALRVVCAAVWSLQCLVEQVAGVGVIGAQALKLLDGSAEPFRWRARSVSPLFIRQNRPRPGIPGPSARGIGPVAASDSDAARLLGWQPADAPQRRGHLGHAGGTGLR